MTGGQSELDDVLDRAGLERVGSREVPGVRLAAAAWRAVRAGGDHPAVVVPADHPDLAAEVNRQWHRLAVEQGVFARGGSSDGVGGSCGGVEPASEGRSGEGPSSEGPSGEAGAFLIDVPGTPGAGGRRRRGWSRVRLSDRWDLAGALDRQSGGPEFVTTSLDGERVLGCTTEAGAVRLVAVRELSAWLEASARSRAGAPTDGGGGGRAGGGAGVAWSTPTPQQGAHWGDGQ
ncbi:hypothetical protein ACFC1F_23030, partial [Kitasatospora sp. NPDC056181]